jgi:hypothetical protein
MIALNVGNFWKKEDETELLIAGIIAKHAVPIDRISAVHLYRIVLNISFLLEYLSVNK